MIKVTIELISAISGETSEIGRMYIANTDEGTTELSDYDVGVCRRGTTKVPAEVGGVARSARSGKVLQYPRLAYNVWRLIARAVLSAFPEEQKVKPGKAYKAEISADVLRGLQLMKKHFNNGGRMLSEGSDTEDFDSAFEWLDVANEEPNAKY
jgi:hypothetical protein